MPVIKALLWAAETHPIGRGETLRTDWRVGIFPFQSKVSLTILHRIRPFTAPGGRAESRRAQVSVLTLPSRGSRQPGHGRNVPV